MSSGGDAKSSIHVPRTATLASVDSLLPAATAAAAAGSVKELQAFEQSFVHHVYDVIADHFSHTRHTMWPQVRIFLESLPSGSFVADVGCGNGKYMLPLHSTTNDATTAAPPSNDNKSPAPDASAAGDAKSDAAAATPSADPTGLCMIGCDISESLIRICRVERNLEVLTCDSIRLPYRSNSFDAALSIAVIHHFASPDRRLLALTELHRILRVGGRALIYVWSYEEGGQLKQKKVSKFSAQEQVRSADVLIPWAMPNRFQPPNADSSAAPSTAPSADTKQSATAAAPVAASGKAKKQKPMSEKQAAMHAAAKAKKQQQLAATAAATAPATTPPPAAAVAKPTAASTASEPLISQARPDQNEVQYVRYYHLFKKTELEELVQQLGVARVRIAQSGFDHQNWFVVFEKLS